ncbi:MAG: MBL fold metallo-hydrolase [Acidobacteria bacterium]|nr:MBL fold metallo-hydrolase [Acidobacteriota bacterium]
MTHTHAEESMMNHLPTTRYTRAGACRAMTLVAMALLTGPVGVHTQAPAPATLDIYWIDVEGGAATLVVTPERDAVLMDTGWPRADARDARRIQAAMRDAGITEIDYLLISHFHQDHVGGLAALAERVPIGQIVDHGDSVERDREQGRAIWEDYLALAEGRRRTVTAGDKLPLRRIEFSFVASHGAFIETLEPRPPNRLCATAVAGPVDQGENSRSLGYLLSLGGFQFLNLGDLTPNHEYDLACPENRLGVVDLYQVPHHGGGGAARPELTWALQPTVAVTNNGPRKGGSPASYAVVRDAPGIQDVWQLHRPLGAEAASNTDPRLIANLTEEDDCLGYWIKATVQPDGRSWTMTNGRTGYSRNYLSK